MPLNILERARHTIDRCCIEAKESNYMNSEGQGQILEALLSRHNVNLRRVHSHN